MKELEGQLQGRGRRVTLVASRFNETIVARLVEGARRCLRQHGVAEGDIELVWVPGAFELPQAVAGVLAAGGRDAVVALGAVIRGDTPHFEYVASAASLGLAAEARSSSVPVTFGLLTVNGLGQAEARSGGKLGNKGYDAALAALEMISVLERLRAAGPASGAG
ncbi:MAG: 6,7-dimethyl-8-ribityllumazine synthase [Candidatus Dormibacteria bacterium]